MSEENETLGSYLRRERKKRDISLEQVSYATRISLKMLSSLEEDTHEDLPAEPFVRGYLQAYAKYVKLDSKDVLLRYQHHLAIAPTPKIEEIKESRIFAQEETYDHKKLLMALVICVIVLAGSGTYLWVKNKMDEERAKRIRRTPILQNASVNTNASESSEQEAVSSSTDVSESQSQVPEAVATSTPAPVEPAKVEPVKAPEAAPAIAPEKPPTPAVTEVSSDDEDTGIIDPIGKDLKYNLKLTAKEDVWIRFQSDQGEIKDLILRRGRSLMIRGNKVIRLFSGNIQGLEAEFNGQSMDQITGEGRKRSVVLPLSEIPNVPLPLFPENVGGADQEV